MRSRNDKSNNLNIRSSDINEENNVIGTNKKKTLEVANEKSTFYWHLSVTNEENKLIGTNKKSNLNGHVYDEIEKSTLDGVNKKSNLGVSLCDVTVGYPDKVIFENFDIKFEANKINVVLGGSGVGKSTLLNVVAGLKEYSGKVVGAEGGVSYIFQKDRLIPTISIYKNLDMVLRATIKDKKIRKKEIEKMLKLLEIDDQMYKLPSGLSGGQSQRVAMARAFLYDSHVLLLDEPFRALDTSLKMRLLHALFELNEKSPRTIIFVTHAIDECLLAADKYFVLGQTSANFVCDKSNANGVCNNSNANAVCDNSSANIALAKSPAKVVFEGEITLDKWTRNLSDASLEGIRSELLKALL